MTERLSVRFIEHFKEKHRLTLTGFKMVEDLNPNLNEKTPEKIFTFYPEDFF